MVETIMRAGGVQVADRQRVAELVRIYIRNLRERRGKTQEEMAEAIGLGYRTYVDYELGETKELKGTPLVRAIAFLDGSFEHLRVLTTEHATAALALDLVETLFTDDLTARERAEADAIPPDEYHTAVMELMSEVEREPIERAIRLLSAIRGFVAGWRAKPDEPDRAPDAPVP